MSVKTEKYKISYKNFGLALLSLLLAVVITLIIPSLSDGGMYFLFLTAIIFTTLYAEVRAGIFAAVLSLIVNFFLLDYLGKMPRDFGDWLVLGAFGLAAGFTIFICYAQITAENARRLAEDKYRMIFEDAITGIYETTIDGKYAAANPKLAEMFGYESSAEMIQSAENLNRKFYVEAGRREEFARLVEENNSLAGFESQIYRCDDKIIWITENALAVRDENGKLVGFQGTTIEITDRKCAETALQKARSELEEKVIERTAELNQANEILREEVAERMRIEIALRQSEEKFRAIVETSSDWIWETDENGFYTYASPKIKETLNYEPEEIIGKRAYDLMLPEEAARVFKILKPIVSEKKSFAFLESFSLHKDGTRVNVSETSGVPFFDAEGKFAGYRGIARDTTQRKSAEAALRKIELHLRSVVTAAPVVLFALDRAGIFTLSEGKGLEFLGLQAGEVVGKSVFEIYRDFPNIIADMKRALGGESFVSTIEIADLIFESRYTPVFNDEREISGIIGVSTDISERKRIENKLLASQKQLRELSGHLQSVREEERKYIARELHDELGQTLTALKIDLVRLDEKTQSEKKNLTAAQIKERIPAMLTIVDMAMETTRKIVAELRPGVLDELGLAAALEWQVQEFQKRTKIKCRLEIEFDENAACQNLKTTIFRILQECLTNIARHSDAKTAQITLKDEGFRIFFEVEDDGRGISERDLEKSRSFGILGMRERAILLGGTVEISRVAIGGTRVTVAIPRPDELIKLL